MKPRLLSRARFTSDDKKMHVDIVPLFLGKNQVFLEGGKMKNALHEVDQHYEGYELEVKQRGILTFALFPPLELSNAVTSLWDEYCPNWRLNSRNHKESHSLSKSSILNRIQELKNSNTTNRQVGESEIDQVFIRRKVSRYRGKWKL